MVWPDDGERAAGQRPRSVRAWRSSAQQLGHKGLPIRCELLAQRARVDPCARKGLRLSLPTLELEQLFSESRRFFCHVDRLMTVEIRAAGLVAWQHTQFINRFFLTHFAVFKRWISAEGFSRWFGLHRPPSNALVRDILQRERVS